MGQANGKLLEMHARQRLGMPDSWRAFSFDTIREEGTIKSHRITGAVLRHGTLSGRHGLSSRDRNSDCTTTFTPGEHESWVRCWESRTGLCRTCLGSGQEIESAVHATYRRCQSCDGSGRAEGRAA